MLRWAISSNKKHYYLPHALMLVTILLAGCASNPANQWKGKDTVIKEKLLTSYSKWKGTPYKYDSISKKGIDCSGLVYVTFKSQFGINLPRSTNQQAKVGEKVSKSALHIGDLVFFKTGIRTYHVGVYMGGNRFMHASTSHGVKISRLSNPYWKKTYWTSRHILG